MARPVSVQALAFAARRLRAESVALVFAAREPEDMTDLAGLPELAVTGLPDEDARELLRTSLPGPLDERVLDRFVAETRGNPLALLELPKEATLEKLAGGFGVPDIGALAGRLQVVYQRRLAELPEKTRRLLLVAAAEPGGRPVLLWRAADRLGIGIEAASPEDRRATHRVLAEVTDPESEPERRAWHSAQSTQEPDEGIAAETGAFGRTRAGAGRAGRRAGDPSGGRSRYGAQAAVGRGGRPARPGTARPGPVAAGPDRLHGGPGS